MKRLLLIDDDDTTRDVLGLLLRTDGWDVADAERGEAAVLLAATFSPNIVLSDLQMPGLCGAELAAALRVICAGSTVFLAMTATQSPETPEGYDAVLVKPFTANTVREAILGVRHPAESADAAVPVLAMATFERMRKAMPPAQLRALYDFALEDAERRIQAMEGAADQKSLRGEAHALKGSCGMIGAERLRALSASIEQNGRTESSMRVQMVADFRGEISHLRRMLERLFRSTR